MTLAASSNEAFHTLDCTRMKRGGMASKRLEAGCVVQIQDMKEAFMTH